MLSRTPPSFSSIVRDTEDDSFISSLGAREPDRDEPRHLFQTLLPKGIPASLDASADHARKPIPNHAVQFHRGNIGYARVNGVGEHKAKLAV